MKDATPSVWVRRASDARHAAVVRPPPYYIQPSSNHFFRVGYPVLNHLMYFSGYVSKWSLLTSSLEPIKACHNQKEREIPEMIQSEHTDIVLEKSTFSIFIGTNFEYMMRNHTVTTLIFTGIATEMGIESSERDASATGFYPVVISNYVSSFDKDAHERSLKTMTKLFIVETADNILKNID